jgi:hypothetical protein
MTQAATTNIDQFAQQIFEACDNLERHGLRDKADNIRAMMRPVVSWLPRLPDDLIEARKAPRKEQRP